MSKYSISLFFLLFLTLGFSQENKPDDSKTKDSIQYKQEYGLRVGVDLSRPVLSYFIEDYTGFEIVGDYRLTDKLYIAAELGNEEKTLDEDVDRSVLYDYTVKGSYLKVGADYNTYENWFGMNNQITVGGRFAYSTFNSTINNFVFFDSDRFFSPDTFVQGSDLPIELKNLNAYWLEFVVALKAELFANIYIGMSIRLAHLLSTNDPDNFRNLWIPGFNRVTDESKWGVGFNYSISYLIPFYKKAKKKKKKVEEQTE